VRNSEFAGRYVAKSQRNQEPADPDEVGGFFFAQRILVECFFQLGDRFEQVARHAASGCSYELARFGARVLHWGTLEPAASDEIPVRVLNARRRGGTGTAVAARPARRVPSIVGLAHQAGVTVVDVRSRGVVGSLRFLLAAMEWLEREVTAPR